jgi:hypothetical protein
MSRRGGGGMGRGGSRAPAPLSQAHPEFVDSAIAHAIVSQRQADSHAGVKSAHFDALEAADVLSNLYSVYSEGAESYDVADVVTTVSHESIEAADQMMMAALRAAK